MQRSFAAKRASPWLLVLGYFGLATVVMTWPAVTSIGTAVVGGLGDNLHFAWLIAWFDQAILSLHRLPFFAPHLNYPEGWHLARSEITPVQVLQGLPFTRLGGPILAFNAVALLSFVFSGLSAYVCTLKLSGQRIAALIAGTLFAFSPFRIAHWRVGQLNVLGTLWFPIYFVALADVLRGKGSGRWAGAIAGLALGLISLTSQYYLYMTLVASALGSAIYLLGFRRDRLGNSSLWRSLATMAMVAAPLIAIGLFPYIELALQDSYPSRSLYDVSSGSASVTDFLLPSTDHFLWGGWVGENFSRDHWPEATLYFGVITTGLALLAVLKAWRAGSGVRVLVVFAGVSILLSLGVHLYWNEQLVLVRLPEAIASILHRDETRVPMLGYLLHKFVPFFSMMRTFKRTGALALTAIALLAGIGAAELLNRLKSSWRMPAGVLLLAMVWLDFYPGPFKEFSKVEPRAVDQWLATQPGNGAVAEFPFWLEEEQFHVYSTLTHGKPFLGGFFNAFPPPQYQRIWPVMEEFPNEASVRLLEELGVRYVLVETALYQNFMLVDRMIRDLGMKYQANLDGVVVYEIPLADLGE